MRHYRAAADEYVSSYKCAAIYHCAGGEVRAGADDDVMLYVGQGIDDAVFAYGGTRINRSVVEYNCAWRYVGMV